MYGGSRRLCSIIRGRNLATVASANSPIQTLTEKIVQNYAVDLSPGQVVRAGDYVSIRPRHCMTHDNCKLGRALMNSLAGSDEVYEYRRE